jgi:hypothetical protein
MSNGPIADIVNDLDLATAVNRAIWSRRTFDLPARPTGLVDDPNNAKIHRENQQSDYADEIDD